MLSTYDIQRLDELVHKEPKLLLYAEILFLFYKFPELYNDVRSTSLPPIPDLKITPKKLSELCKEKIESILQPLKNAYWIKEPLNFDHSPYNELAPYDRLLCLKKDIAKTTSLPDTATNVISQIIERKRIPIAFFKAIWFLPSSAVPPKLNELIEEKREFLMSILNTREQLFQATHEQIERSVLKGLLKNYPLNHIAEAYAYQATHMGYIPQHHLEAKSYSFNSPAHKELFARRLKETILHSPHTISDLSFLSGISRDTIYTLCNPKNKQKSVSFNTLYRLSKFLNCSTDFLMGKVEEKEQLVVEKTVLLRKATRSIQSHKDFLNAALRQRSNCTSVLQLLIASESVLFPNDFKKIEELIKTLLSDHHKVKKLQKKVPPTS